MTGPALKSCALCLAAIGALTVIAAQAQTANPAPAPPPSQPAAAPSPQATAESIEACTLKTDELLVALDRKDWAGAERDFNAQMLAGLTAAQLQQGWESLPAKFGQPGPRGTPQNSYSNGYVVITVPMQFQNGNLAAQVACGADGKIAGFHAMTLPPPPAPASS